jgi:hypothetical protein
MKFSFSALTAVAFLTANASAVTITMSTVSGGQVAGGNFNQGIVGTAANTNNWPAAEFPANATDNNSATKYLNFAKTDTGIVVTPAGGSAALNSMAFTTANDSPNRDPLTFSLWGSVTPLSAGNFSMAGLTPIVTGASTGLTVDPGRFITGAAQTFTNNVAYASYVLTFPTVRDSATANSMQVADVTFSNVPEPGTSALAGLALLGLARRKRSQSGYGFN